MFTRLIALIAENGQFVEFATGNTLFGLSAAALMLVGGWVLFMRSRNQRM